MSDAPDDSAGQIPGEQAPAGPARTGHAQPVRNFDLEHGGTVAPTGGATREDAAGHGDDEGSLGIVAGQPIDGPGDALRLGPYVADEDREHMRGVIALILLGILTVIVVGAFASLWTGWEDDWEVVDRLLTHLVAPVVGLVGAVTGFYYGNQASQQAAANRQLTPERQPPAGAHPTGRQPASGQSTARQSAGGPSAGTILDFDEPEAGRR